jgi:hypothetical protein
VKILALAIGALAALTVAPAAGAKGSAPSQICGATECVQLDGSPESLIILDHDATTPAPPVTGYYRVEYAASGIGQHLFVPDRSRLAVPTAGGRALQWYALYGSGPENLLRAVKTLEPFSPPARWPDSVDAVTASFRGPVPDKPFDLRPLIFGAILLAVVSAVLLARQQRVRRPRTA